MVIKKEGEWFISCCPILDVLSQGRNEQEAKKNLREALVMFLESCIKRGTLDAVLKECGFKLYHEEVVEKELDSSSKEEFINIPIHLIAPKDSRRVCHA